MVEPPESARTPQAYSFVGMGVWLVRRQALLVLLVGMLAGLALTGVVASRSGLSGPLALKVGSLMGGLDTRLPTRIEVAVASPPPPGVSSGPVAPPPASPAGTSDPWPAQVVLPPAPPARAPVPVTVVPAPVYSYPPDEHGGPDPGSGDGSGGGGHH